MKLRWQIIIFGLVHALIFTAFFQASINNNLAWSNADRLYLSYASRLFSGELFYRDFFIEYPPLAMLFFSLPRLVTGDLDGYIIAFTIETFIADLVALVLLALLSRRLGVRPRYTMLAMTVALIALGPIMISRYDIFPAVMVLAGFFLFFRGRDTMPWIWLALGTVTKLYPVLLTPLLAAYYWRTSQYRQLVKGSSAFVLLIAAVILPFLIIAPDGFTAFLKYQLVRGLQLESVYSSFLLIGHIIHNGAITVTYNFGSWNLVTQAADFIAEISFYLSLYVLIVVFALMVKYIYQCDPAVPREQLISPWAAYGLTIYSAYCKMVLSQACHSVCIDRLAHLLCISVELQRTSRSGNVRHRCPISEKPAIDCVVCLADLEVSEGPGKEIRQNTK
jgi:hypothetical protein